MGDMTNSVLYEDKLLGGGNEGDLTAQPGPGIGVSTGANDSGSVYPDPALISEPPGTPGIGMAPAQQTTAPRQISTPDRLLHDFAALVHGRPTYDQIEEDRALRRKQIQLEDLKGSITALEHGATMAAGLAEGEEKTKFLDAYAGRLDAISPGLGDTFKAVASKPGFADQMKKYADKSPTIRRSIELDPTGKAAFNLLKSPDAQNTIQKEMDASVMPLILKKGQTFTMGWQQIVPKEMVDQFNKDGRLSASELIRANEWIKENKPEFKALVLSDEELGTIHRNSDAFYHSLGIISPKDEGEILKAKAKGEDKNPISRDKPVMQGGKRMVQREEWINGKWEPVGDLVPFFKEDQAGGPAAVPEELAGLHGDDYLKKLPAGEGGLVKKIAQGEVDPKTLSIRGGHREKVLQQVVQYDPTFDQTNFSARNAVRKDFTSGTASKNVTAINTALGHLGTMQEVGDKLANKDIRAWNQVANALGVQMGAEEATDSNVVQGAVADELMRVFRVVGASEKEAEAWGKRFSNAGSPSQINGAIRTAADLLGSRIEALDDQWKRGMGTDKGYPKLLSDKSKETFKKIGGKLERYGIEDKGGSGGAGATPATNSKGWKLMVDAKGNKAYVGPNNEIEPVK